MKKTNLLSKANKNIPTGSLQKRLCGDVFCVLHVEQEIDNIPVLDHVVLAFGALEAFGTNGGVVEVVLQDVSPECGQL